MLSPKLLTLAAFSRARYRMYRLNTRAKLETFQSRRIERFLQDPVPYVGAYKGVRFRALADAPLMDKDQLMTRFDAYNRLALSADIGWSIFDGDASPPAGYSVGASTGTSGNRGLYVVSDAERYTWLGVMLSRAFPSLLTQRERVAVILPQASRLYDAANESKRLRLKFFDLASGVEAQVEAVTAFRPTVIVAPPRVLTVLAEADVQLEPKQVFSGAEVLDPADRAIIEARFGLRVREIYMATEGLFAVACAFGKLHLIEDHMAFEWLPVKGSRRLVTPLITDFTRRTQIMLRYRMNDLIELDTDACDCGSPHLSIKQIVGRNDDVFVLHRSNGERITFTPDIIRNTVLNADRSITDYRVIQTAADQIKIELPLASAKQLSVVVRALQALFEKANTHPIINGDISMFSDSGQKKRRRILVNYTGDRL